MDAFLDIYNRLNSANLHLLGEIYTTDIHFVDPAHELHGLDALTAYFRSLYENVTRLEFDFGTRCRQDSRAFVSWQMKFQHPRLKSNREISVPGASLLYFNDGGKVYYHRDYFDLGAMLYEQLPLLGRIIRTIKGRLGS